MKADEQGHRAAYAASREDRDRTHQAMSRLQESLARASAGEEWLGWVASGLAALAAAMAEELAELKRPDSLLALIASGHPRRFGSRIRILREQYDDLVRQVASLLEQFAQSDGTGLTPGDIRHRVGWIISALHHCRAQQTDLVYEALLLDLGERARPDSAESRG